MPLPSSLFPDHECKHVQHEQSYGNDFDFGRSALIPLAGYIYLNPNDDFEVYPWQNYSTVCDVGCGQGSFAWPLLEKFPEIKITLFDLPETLEITKQVVPLFLKTEIY